MTSPYDQQLPFSQYQHPQNAYPSYSSHAPMTSAYPSQGFSQSHYAPQTYDPHGQAPAYYDPYAQQPANASYYNGSATSPAQEQDRGLLGAMAGGTAGAWGGHKAGRGLLGAVGGAIVGSLAEDYAKKSKNHKKHGHKPQNHGLSTYPHYGGHGRSHSSSAAMGGIGSLASSLFNQHKR